MSLNYRHVIWDWNGTLLDDTWLCVAVLNGLLKRHGRSPIDETDYRENFGFPVIEFYGFLGFKMDPEAFGRISLEFITDYESRWLAECRLHPETKELLGSVRAGGMTQTVLSAAKQEALQKGIAHFGIADYFAGLAGTDNIRAEGKIALGQAWINRLGIDPAEAVVVGDTLHDHEVAEAMGTDCILIGHGHHSSRRLSVSGRPVVENLDELRTQLGL